jgi:tetratricopeptide (TPR) repeat protein
MTDLSETFVLESEIGPVSLTDGSIALLNLRAQIDGLEGHDTFAEAVTLIDLLILRGQIVGRISDYERAAELANRQVGAALKDAAAYVARARTRAVFHRFTEALDDLDDADRMAPHDAAAKRERAAILQAQGRFDEALSTYSAVIDSVGQFERAAALAGLWAERGEVDRAQRLYLDGLRCYRGISPFPVALLEFQLGVMWMREARLGEARTCFEAAIRRVPAYAPAQGHLAEVEADLGNPQSALARLYPLAVSSDDPDYAAQLARILGEMGLNDESGIWRRWAADRYDELTATHREAFADHAAEFWLDLGNDPKKGLSLAVLNLEVRKTPRARELMARALDANTARATSAHCFGVVLPD